MAARKTRTAIDAAPAPAGMVRVNGKLVPLSGLQTDDGKLTRTRGALKLADASVAKVERLTRYPGGIIVVYSDDSGRRHHVFAIAGRMTELGYHARSGHCFECKSRECAGVDYGMEQLDAAGYVDEVRVPVDVWAARHGNILKPQRRGYR